MTVESSIVVNTSPWIALASCHQIALLPTMYEEVYLPESVRRELLAGGEKTTGVAELESASWLSIESVTNPDAMNLLYELDAGEAEVVLLAREKGIPRVLIDEKVARLQAKAFGLKVIGTLGLLLRAKKQQKVPGIKPLIRQLQDHGFWIHERLIRGVLQEAGELEK